MAGVVAIVTLLMLAQPVAADTVDDAEETAVGVVRDVVPECPNERVCDAVETVDSKLTSTGIDVCRKLSTRMKSVQTDRGGLSCPVGPPGLPDIWSEGDDDGYDGDDSEADVAISAAAYASRADPVSGHSTGVRPDATLDTAGVPAVPADRPYGGVVSLAGLLLLGLAAIPLWLLYRRLSDDDLLDNDLRRRAFDAVGEDPGATPSTIARRLDIHPSTARYHLDLLCEFDYLSHRRFDGNVRYFPNHGRYSDVDKAVADAMDSTGRRDVLLALARAGRLSVGAIAERIDRADSTVSNHVAKLRDAGLLDRERDGRHVHYELPDRVRRAMLRVM